MQQIDSVAARDEEAAKERDWPIQIISATIGRGKKFTNIFFAQIYTKQILSISDGISGNRNICDS